MKLGRNDVHCNWPDKYALIKWRLVDHFRSNPTPDTPSIDAALKLLEDHGILDPGDRRDTAFFVIRLKDQFSAPALAAYAMSAFPHDEEYAREVMSLSHEAANLQRIGEATRPT